MNANRADTGIYGDANQLTLDDQIERARRAASRIDAGYYFTDVELDDEELMSAPHRPHDDGGNEWL
ncbi:hypothetical protein WJ59_33970 [Burkholderia gladioli]|uniref:hypothetical protein n=1 Tax=Burkholderia gladioli TaxID=28095 RepID=UPI0007586FA6|nr:hypothetical protein [Burkholderia gladioli]KVM58466.1 hypothetical protein WJ59_33970 [Burkholderia gladioli]